MARLPHTLYTWKGVFGSATAPIEEWQFSLAAGKPDTSLNAGARAIQAEALRVCYAQNIAPIMKANVILTEVQTVGINALGRYYTDEDGAYERGIWSGSVPGQVAANASATMPLQTALTISLETARVGPTGKGRFFLPWPHANLDTGHRLEEATAQQFADVCAEFVRDVNAVDLPVQVFSSKGYASTVTGIRVGRVPDTMRSRRGDLVESYLRSAL